MLAIRSTPPSRAADARRWPTRRPATIPPGAGPTSRHRARRLRNAEEEIVSSRSPGMVPIDRQIEPVLRP